jgi:hypothetical protein
MPPMYCGANGKFNQCGGDNGHTADGGNPCKPTDCATLNLSCGYANDGCGNLLNCYPDGGTSCPAPTSCVRGACTGNTGIGPDGGSSLCVPLDCASRGYTCGPAGDGCGNVINCYANDGGACPDPGDTCGGGGLPSQCGHSCTGLCTQQQACDGGTLTTITGTVVAGTLPIYGSPDPVPNVLVYVPTNTGPLPPITSGAECTPCGANVNALVSTYTAFDGTFTLSNVPSGHNIPLVIQLGKWRREITVPTIQACKTSAVSDGAGSTTIHMPRTQGEGNIPLTAISTGSVDSIECVLLKMGVDKAEFTPYGATGRIQLYSCAADSNNGHGPGAIAPATDAGATTQCEETLLASGGTYMDYDQILLPCWGAQFDKTNTELQNLVSYANGGGRFFATHFSYTWLYNNNPFNTTATWGVNQGSFGNVTGDIRLPAPAAAPNNPQGTVFADWLGKVGALSQASPPQVSINNPRHDVNSVQGASVDWIDGTDPVNTAPDGGALPMLMHYTFDTPVGAASQCGHAIFSDFHVTNSATSPNKTFPAECDNNPLTAQEKVLEYLIWNLATCVGTPPPAKCTPVTCQSQQITCGPASDGCGGLIQSCGMCTLPQTCGGGGIPGQCGAPPGGGSCTPQTCQDQGINCGPAGDGCGGLIQSCGMCTPPQTCGGGGVPGQCGAPDGGSCTPQTCADQKITCGPAGDGCGNLLQCGTCTLPQTCGGGGTQGQCGAPDAGSCNPQPCPTGVQCGTVSDGCGNKLQCGTCAPPETCGGGGTPGKCGMIQ